MSGCWPCPQTCLAGPFAVEKSKTVCMAVLGFSVLSSVCCWVPWGRRRCPSALQCRSLPSNLCQSWTVSPICLKFCSYCYLLAWRRVGGWESLVKDMGGWDIIPSAIKRVQHCSFHTAAEDSKWASALLEIPKIKVTEPLPFLKDDFLIDSTFAQLLMSTRFDGDFRSEKDKLYNLRANSYIKGKWDE